MILTKAQRKAAHKLFLAAHCGYATYREFRRALVRPMLFGRGAIEVSPWVGGLYVGIETDGYTHS